MIYLKKKEKGVFYFAKIKGKEISTEEELSKCIPKILNDISWKKSMRWSNYNLAWGRPLRSILAIFNNKKLKFKYEHLESVNFTVLEEQKIIQKKIKNFDEYQNFLKKKRDYFRPHRKKKIYFK